MAIGEGYVGVATTDDIAPGRMFRVEMHGVSIIIVNLDNEFFALADTCTHEDASFGTGLCVASKQSRVRDANLRYIMTAKQYRMRCNERMRGK